MLIDLRLLLNKHNVTVTGIVHAGAHYGQEYETYAKIGVKDIIFIEPSKPAYHILCSKFLRNTNIHLFNCAIGAKSFKTKLYVESANKGMSNSLLVPAKHTKQYPEIKFHSREDVQVYKLDSLQFDRHKYNMLYMDIQGYELEALKGAIETLKYIDCIYTEVNRDELYKGCARIEQLDLFLTEFERVHTDWAGGTWGDALYVRKRKRKSIIDVPEKFRPKIKYKYPIDNEIIFEEWVYQNLKENEIDKTEYYYLPIFWTSYYVNNNYGKNKDAIRELQDYIDTLDKNKKYFTIYQYDDGIINDLSRLSVKNFGMSGKNIDYILPLICLPHNIKISSERDLLASYIGRTTHPIRKRIIDAVAEKSGYYISEHPHSISDYCLSLTHSVFTLCPRGYGQTSFRICEALEYGSIPVYISDEFLIPHINSIPFEEYGVIIKPHQIPNIDKILRSISQQEIKRKQDMLKKVYESYYTYEANKRIILANLR